MGSVRPDPNVVGEDVAASVFGRAFPASGFEDIPVRPVDEAVGRSVEVVDADPDHAKISTSFHEFELVGLEIVFAALVVVVNDRLGFFEPFVECFVEIRHAFLLPSILLGTLFCPSH